MPSRTLLRRHTVCGWTEYFGKLFGIGGMSSLEHVTPRSSNNRYFLICLLKSRVHLIARLFFC